MSARSIESLLGENRMMQLEMSARLSGLTIRPDIMRFRQAKKFHSRIKVGWPTIAYDPKKTTQAIRESLNFKVRYDLEKQRAMA